MLLATAGADACGATAAVWVGGVGLAWDRAGDASGLSDRGELPDDGARAGDAERVTGVGVESESASAVRFSGGRAGIAAGFAGALDAWGARAAAVVASGAAAGATSPD
ncbi:MAG: hypothetical protein WA707_20270 [Pseudolabrys sp.]